MGLRLVAHYYDRVEALIVSAALDAAGVPNWAEGHLQISVQPFHEIALGGFRIMVCPEDLPDALDLIAQARASPILEGGVLESRPVVWEPIAWFYPFMPFVPGLEFVWGIVGLLLPLRHRQWRD
jgi:hypothetical protein